MTDIPITGHKLFDALWNREKLVQKESPKVEQDGSITSKPITVKVPEARYCPDADQCVFGHIVKAGGSPCQYCVRLVKGDYLVKEV